MDSAEKLTGILLIVLAVIIFLLMILSFTYLILRYKNKRKKREKKEKQEKDILLSKNKNKVKEELDIDSKQKTYKEYTKESIFKFMDFEKIEDNMIIQEKGKYLMVLECQGINYDLMSEIEKISVEQGFIQFLNTLRHPIQLYIQTRTINLEKSIQSYNDKLKAIEDNYHRKIFEYEEKQKAGIYSARDLQKEYYELTKERNLYEYTKDVISDIEKNSLNKSVLNKKYYIVIPQYQSEMEVGDFSKEEIQNMAFSELYTKAKSIIRVLYSCQINAKILDSEKLTDLLYVAYNRDESDIFGAEKARKAGFQELYSTSQDVFEKKIHILNKEIERKAIELANEKIQEVKSEQEKISEEMEKEIDDFIAQMAEELINENEEYVGEEISQKAISKIKNDNKKGGSENEKKQAKRGRPRTTAK